MSITRSTMLRTLARPFARPSSRLPITAHRFASGDYGSGAGDPKGEKPQQQGSNPSADLEHPGPPPPKVGQGSGSTPTKGTSSGHNTGEAKSGGKADQSVKPSVTSDGGSGGGSGNDASGNMGGKGKESGGSGNGSSKRTQGAQPKILNESPPAEPSGEVKEHNRDMEQRAERANEKVSDEDVEKDKVGKGFW